MGDAITYAGLDVHQEEIAVAGLQGAGREFTEFRVGGDGRGVRKLVRRLSELSAGGRMECAYEAGPCGYALQRQLEKEGIDCVQRSIASRELPDRSVDHEKGYLVYRNPEFQMLEWPRYPV